MADQIELVVPEELDGARVDLAVARLLDLSRAGARELVAAGCSVDGAPASPSDRVRHGQVLVCARPTETPGMRPEPVQFGVLYEDEYLLVVDKPPGVVVHPGSAASRGTLAAGLAHRYPDLVGVGSGERSGLVHRLDKDTSGALLVARDQSSFAALTAQMRRREVARTYTALIEGKMAAATGTVEAPIGRDPARPTRQAVLATGRPARTHYEVMRYWAESDVSLLEVRLETGRTHQIRVHLAAVGHPVVADFAYGATRRDLDAPRTFLHASGLQLTHPLTGEPLMVESPLPADLTVVLDLLS